MSSLRGSTDADAVTDSLPVILDEISGAIRTLKTSRARAQ